MPLPPRSALSRRALLGAAGVSALLTVAGCNPFATAPTTLTVTAEAPPPTTPLLGLVFKTRLHVQHLQAAIVADARDAAMFTMLLHDRKAQLTALQLEYARSIGQTSAATTPVPTTGVTVSGSPDDVIALIRGDAGQAQNMFTDAMATASRYQAELFGSIAACMATHRAVLA